MDHLELGTVYLDWKNLDRYKIIQPCHLEVCISTKHALLHNFSTMHRKLEMIQIKDELSANVWKTGTLLNITPCYVKF